MASESTVELPSSNIFLHVSRPRGRWDLTTQPARTVRAPVGGSLLAVAWMVGVKLQPLPDSLVDGWKVSADLTLVTGGRRYPLASGIHGGASDSALVAVVGDGADAVVEVQFAGVTQRVTAATGANRRRSGPAVLPAGQRPVHR